MGKSALPDVHTLARPYFTSGYLTLNYRTLHFSLVYNALKLLFVKSKLKTANYQLLHWSDYQYISTYYTILIEAVYHHRDIQKLENDTY